MLLLFITIISEYPLAQSAMNAAGWLGSNPEGLTSQSMQAGAIGLLLTLLLISVPPMAALFFNGTMGTFLYASVFKPEGGGNAPSQMPGTYGQPSLVTPRTTETDTGQIGRSTYTPGDHGNDLVKRGP